MKRIHLIILSAAVLLTAGSCKKWLDINTDPSNPQIAKAEMLLSPIQWQISATTANDYRFLFKTIQNWSSANADNNWEAHGYEPTLDNGGAIWRMLYITSGPNLELLIKEARENGKWTFAGIGYALKAYGFQLTTDLHGPIILDQAFDTTRLFFNYQDQPDVYARVREWTDSSLACFSRTDWMDYSNALSTADIIYKGDRDKWKKFVYAILAQQYSHLVKKANFASQYADSVIKYVDLSFIGAQEDATILAGNTNSNDANVFSPSAATNLVNITSTATQTYTGRISQPILSMLTGGVRGTPTPNPTGSTDPRLRRMIAADPLDGIYKAIVPTMGDVTANKRVPLVWGYIPSGQSTYTGKYLYYAASRYPILSYSQLQFAKAEALFIKNEPGLAHDAYKNGINGHMQFVNLYGSPVDPKISQTEIDAYMNSTEVAQNGGELKLSDIMTQKYISQWGWAGMETFNDLRKYDYDTAVFKNLYFYQPEDLYASNLGKLCYRYRPRYNSEYVWNKTELAKWKGTDPNYNTLPTWAMTPDQ
ncbi:SusD/RagB family nutrient-binding outer membrane lipoprotein [Pseudobacter ginsenosidimutans]|uniref:SusD-like starch-binding protein associating with outer membrane n=1 Tax=Pseudobacter ginsenosidimutans TaxID=661488 RepID=A0A4Q7N5L0_9BACT|nr:SusD/RagB family nutrient-binding outer membrane lipoprotein [Pseudobacter ginsenosidimutans]QEC44853.1 SusD/RagB family nutrient-binding outer membrane lipoprotein [Pseudobacter ginsenosidimutans]RZS76344.1 SusD-like starch-binding protein associating with outer membrane [Pseudobacter ginsenosidimutans]